MKMLRHILSRLTKNDAVHGCPADAVLFGEDFNWNTFLEMTATRFGNLFISDLRVGVRGVAWRATLANFVPSIFGMGTKTKVGDIDATGIVARVHDDEAIRNGAALQFPRDTMGGIAYIVQPQISVARAIFGTLPFPTVIDLSGADVLPKGFFESQFEALVLMPINKLLGFAFDITDLAICLFGDWGKLSTSTLAVAIGGVVRGMIGVHENLHFSATPPNDSSRCGGNFIGRYSFIIPLGGAL